jgi:membrane associated rhomboid family serine protease
MGIYDRDYYRNPPHRSAFGRTVNPWSVNTWLIILNVAVFVANLVLVLPGATVQEQVGQDLFGNAVYAPVAMPPIHPIEVYGWFSVTTALGHLQLWRLVTFQFLHAGFDHILFNMIALFFFGPLIESYLGSRRYLAFYLLCGVAGPIMYILLWQVGLLSGGPSTPLVGASAGIFGVLIAGATVAPNSEVLIWGVLPMKLRTFAWVLLAIAAWTVFQHGATGSNNAGGQAAHLGGAAAGYALIRYPRVLDVFDRIGRRRPSMRFRP